MNKPMYRAQIIERPEFETYFAFDERNFRGLDGEEWSCPLGWEATPDYIERFGTNKYFEPDTDKWFKSRSSAASRVALLESMGYRAIVQRSAPVVWPRDGEARVSVSPDVAAALRIVRDAGFTVTY